jgi:predicted transcriptional regulator
MRRDMLVEEIMQRDVVKVDTDKPITYALKLMKKANADGFLVIEGDALVGSASYWDLMVRLGSVRVRGADASSIYVSSVMEPVEATLSPKSRVVEVARLMVESPFRVIPILEGGEVIGVLEPRDLAKALLNDDIPAPSLSLKSTPRVAVSDRVVHARRLMIDEKVRSLAVVNYGSAVGVLDDDQVVDAFVDLISSLPPERQRAGIRRLTVADLGPKRVKMRDDVPLSEVAKLIVWASVKGVPIVDDEGMLTGFVTVRELAKFISAQA